jgi:hypothetical protein
MDIFYLIFDLQITLIVSIDPWMIEPEYRKLNQG